MAHFAAVSGEEDCRQTCSMNYFVQYKCEENTASHSALLDLPGPNNKRLLVYGNWLEMVN